jgi:hypothetical protein
MIARVVAVHRPAFSDPNRFYAKIAVSGGCP